ncbi:hypothetical protein M422DRAFT_55675 [Sphaerobolus stellatus SS14]|uniref:Uncharacterized protein n=1 Tax=Sphaerobolus stellatus (strain SS14) TaxID=990650 RepID=A0A0C9TAL6_SPHS4|nr:hypothetical protein M422DRAFT_55675 [Sphaerobolus stellatus SS14]
MTQAKIKPTPHRKPSDVSRKQHCCRKCGLPKFGHTEEKCQAQLRLRMFSLIACTHFCMLITSKEAEQQQITPVSPPPAAVIGGPSRPKLINGQSRIRVTTAPRSHNFEGPGQQQVRRSTAAPPSSNNPWSLYGKDDEQIMKELADPNWKGNMLEVLEWATGMRV